MNATVVAMPVRDYITAPTRACLDTKTDGPVMLLTEIGLPVDVARNLLARRILALSPRPRYVIWADTDAVWTANTFDRLRADVDRLGAGALIGALHGARAPFTHPHVLSDMKPPTGTPIVWGVNYPRKMDDPDALLRVTFVGAHMYAHDVRLLERLPPNPWSLSPGDASEDFAFVRRVRSAGTVWCDTACVVLHYDETTGYGFLPGHVPPFRVGNDGTLEPVDDATALTVSREARPRSYGAEVDERMRQMRIAASSVPNTRRASGAI